MGWSAPRREHPQHFVVLDLVELARVIAHRGDQQYTALYSTTARVHQLARTRDRVVIYQDGAGGEG